MVHVSLKSEPNLPPVVLLVISQQTARGSTVINLAGDIHSFALSWQCLLDITAKLYGEYDHTTQQPIINTTWCFRHSLRPAKTNPLSVTMTVSPPIDRGLALDQLLPCTRERCPCREQEKSPAAPGYPSGEADAGAPWHEYSIRK